MTRSPSLDLPDAVDAPAGSPDVGVPWHFGDPHREQRLLLSGDAVVDLSHRGVVAVTGPDRLSWLHSLATQDLDRLPPGGSALALILSPHGHVEHELHVVDDGTTTWIGVEPGTAPALVAYLDSMRFLLRVEVADLSDSYAVVADTRREPHGELPTYLVPEVFGTADSDDPEVARYVPHRPGVLTGREVIVARERLAELVDARAHAGTWAWEALRIAAAVPRLGLDTDHRTIPHEVGWVPAAVHLDKGCYRGQETVARVHNLGRPPRRLVQLHLDGSAEHQPAHGDDVQHEGRSVGTVTSVALHAELGPVALALVKRALPVDVPLVVVAPNGGTVAAAPEVVVTP